MPAKPLLRDRVALWLNTPCLDAAIAAARDMRSATRTVVVTPNLFLAYGGSGVRCIFELGISDVLLNLGLLGAPSEIWECVTEAAKLTAKAISLSALNSVSVIRHAVAAAEASKQITLRVARPLVFLSVLPPSVGDAEMVDDLGMRVRRAGHVEQTARNLLEAGADGIILEYEDVKYVRRVSKKIPLLIFSQRRVRNYAEADTEDEKKKAGITEIIKRGASHVIFDSELIRNTDVEWAADMVNKEVEAATARKK